MFITGMLIIFCKVDMAPAVFVILGIALIRQLIFERNIAKSLLLIMGLTVLPILMMYALGYFSDDSETSSLKFGHLKNLPVTFRGGGITQGVI